MLRAEGLTVSYGSNVVLDGVDLEVPDGQVVAVLGPSGCGKTTLLRVLAGLEQGATGSVFWDGRSLDGVRPHERGFGLMFQEYALFPHKSVFGNVAFGLRMEGRPAPAVDARVSEVLEWVGLEGYEGRSVGGLSGGEQQRVALARALAPVPRLLMLDEPLGSLDRSLRERLVLDIRRLLTERGMTALYVTHDQEEAFAVSDFIVVMRAGAVVQSGPADEVWRRPADEWVARFLGFRAIADAEVEAHTIRLPWGGLPLPEKSASLTGSRRVVLRPDALTMSRHGRFSGVAVARAFKGGRYVFVVRLVDGSEIELEGGRESLPTVGEEVRFDVDVAALTIL